MVMIVSRGAPPGRHMEVELLTSTDVGGCRTQSWHLVLRVQIVHHQQYSGAAKRIAVFLDVLWDLDLSELERKK
eukprot:CAMPEP_0204568118 /NCGR_PEP_ID=MMETSP0661-20131031/36993_1 /ASSEMBLY_ACC=CAM_ASM_000606 /TAXON_ID=109239 /ORGANISM="Alexandrium margalefi, Strain AMGDE01CS-322" /LENGTH=73 /DNA_ID=CAMNT_0051576101 /DNA_START=24 /DNA_END=242 /DNA_ORIENTATION=-